MEQLFLQFPFLHVMNLHDFVYFVYIRSDYASLDRQTPKVRFIVEVLERCTRWQWTYIFRRCYLLEFMRLLTRTSPLSVLCHRLKAWLFINDLAYSSVELLCSEFFNLQWPLITPARCSLYSVCEFGPLDCSMAISICWSNYRYEDFGSSMWTYFQSLFK